MADKNKVKRPNAVTKLTISDKKSDTATGKSTFKLAWFSQETETRPVDGYDVQIRKKGGSWVTVRNSNDGTSTSVTIGKGERKGDTLYAGKTYKARVRANNTDAGYTGPWVETGWATMPAVKTPPKVLNFKATLTSPTKAKLTWSENKSNGNTYDSLEVAVKKNEVTQKGRYYPSGNSIEIDLVKGNYYTFLIRTERDGRYGAWVESNLVIAESPSSPLSATNVKAVYYAGNRFRLSWKNHATVKEPVDNVKIFAREYSSVPDEENPFEEVSAEIGGMKNWAFVDAPFEKYAGKKWQFMVELSNEWGAVGSMPSAACAVPPGLPDALEDLEAELVYGSGGSASGSFSHVQLEWIVPESADKGHPCDSVLIDRSIDGGAYRRIATVPGECPYYEDRSIGNNHRYAYRLTARNSAGNSPGCYSEALRTPPSAPKSVSAARRADSSVVVSIDNRAVTADRTELQRSLDMGISWSIVTEDAYSGFVDTYEPVKASAVRYRARNIMEDYESPWAAMAVDLPADSRLAPTLANPPAGAVVATDSGEISLSWRYENPTGAELHSSLVSLKFSWQSGNTAKTNTCNITVYNGKYFDGEDWNVTDGESVSIPTSYLLEHGLNVADPSMSFGSFNPTITWSVATYPVKASNGTVVAGDKSNTSEQRALYPKRRPQVEITYVGGSDWVTPADSDDTMLVARSMPIGFEASCIDACGDVAGAEFTISDTAGKILYYSDAGVALRHGVPRDAWTPEDGVGYVATATIRSTSSLQGSVSVPFKVEFERPKPASLSIDARDADGSVALVLHVNQEADAPNPDGTDLWRVVDGKETLLQKGMSDGEEYIDIHAPVNMPYNYRTVTYTNDGGYRTTDHPGILRSDWAYLLLDDGRIARGKWSPEETVGISRSRRTFKEFDGIEFPVVYDGGGVSETRELSFRVKAREEAAAILGAAYEGMAIYKSLTGDVMRVSVDAEVARELGAGAKRGDVSVHMTRVHWGNQ